MRKKILVFSFIILVMSIFVASEVFAECRPGKIEVTIVNPVGKVITICVSDEAVDKIGGDGDVVIPAACPCWSPTSIDVNARFIDVTESCDYVMQVDQVIIGSMVHIDVPGSSVRADVGFDVGSQPQNNGCLFTDEPYGVLESARLISYEEAWACYEILVNSDMWALNCESP